MIFLVVDIHNDMLTDDESSVDIATTKNLQNLVQIGEKLLDKRVSRVNLETGKFVEVVDAGTNREALTGFAKLLSAEKKLREAN